MHSMGMISPESVPWKSVRVMLNDLWEDGHIHSDTSDITTVLMVGPQTVKWLQKK